MFLSKLTVTVIVTLTLVLLSVQKEKENTKYILFDVTPGEGFNFRREVFARVANFIKHLNSLEKGKYVLVLPHFPKQWHWTSPLSGMKENQWSVPYEKLFDIDSISRYIPVITMTEFIEKTGGIINIHYIMQRHPDNDVAAGKYHDVCEVQECHSDTEVPYQKKPDGYYRGRYFGADLVAGSLECLSCFGSFSVVTDLIVKSTHTSIMLDRVEDLFHQHKFGGVEHWMVRRASRFNPALVARADQFRFEELGMDDERDKTRRPARWEDHIPKRDSAVGGPYIAVNLRLNNYIYYREDQIPSLKGAAEQVIRKLKEFQLTTVFLATDGMEDEVKEFRNYFPAEYKVVKYEPTEEELREFVSLGVAIIDQIICSYARYFIGSYESTFTFRIQEEREILGFKKSNTFDVLCADEKRNCEKGSIWTIVYPESEEPIDRDEL